MTGEPHICPMYSGHCKHGHPRTKETTFERIVMRRGKAYIVRECRVCHSARNNKTPSWSRFQSRSKWSDVRGGA